MTRWTGKPAGMRIKRAVSIVKSVRAPGTGSGSGQVRYRWDARHDVLFIVRDDVPACGL